LRWNCIRKEGALAIAHSIEVNDTLSHVDLSHNSFGSSFNPEIGQLVVEQLGMLFEHNRTLRTLNLSTNHFHVDDISIMNDGLAVNQTLVQLSFADNCAYVDSKGFLVVQNRGHVSSDPTGRTEHLTQEEPPSTKMGMWIDSGWSEVRFAYHPKWSNRENLPNLAPGLLIGEESLEVTDQDVCIHFSFDSWRPDAMEKDEASGGWQVHRMLPPGVCFYFFSFSNDGSVRAASDHNVVRCDECSVGTSLLPHSLRALNSLEVSPRDQAAPFELKKEYPRRPWYGGKVAAPTLWKLENSIFKERPLEVESKDFYDSPIMQRAYDRDWETALCKFTKFIKDPSERGKVKMTLEQDYLALRECFRYYAAEGGGNDPFSITFNDFSDFCLDCEIVDEQCSLSTVDTIFIATNFEVEKNDDNPDHALDRPEFLEAVTRLALAKYKGGLSPAQALHRLIHENIVPNADRHNCDKFRKENLYLPGTDYIFRQFEKSLVAMMKQYGSTRKRLDGKMVPHLSYSAFVRIIQEGDLMNERLSLEKVKFCFVNSNFTCCDDSCLYNKFASFVDFLEALAWAAHLRNPVGSDKVEGVVERKEGIGAPLEILITQLITGIVKNNKKMKAKLTLKRATGKLLLISGGKNSGASSNSNRRKSVGLMEAYSKINSSNRTRNTIAKIIQFKYLTRLQARIRGYLARTAKLKGKC
jgi:hypothetical protein